MPSALFAKAFTQDLVASLGEFNFGSGVFATNAAAWLRCTEAGNSALSSIERGTDVWLYFMDDESQAFVGFCSLGPTGRDLADVPKPIAMIPQFAVCQKFHGFPPGEIWENRISAQIMRDILRRARELSYRGLTLWVHHANTTANLLYTRMGFKPLPVKQKHGYALMGLTL
jgi:GNAT superfamily N-acetyltransferase